MGRLATAALLVTFLTLGIGCTTSVLGRAATSPHSSIASPEIWRTMGRCGPNCSYMVLKLSGINVTYANIENRLPRDGEGTTLAALGSCLRSFGLDVRIVQGDPNSLARARLPLIAHWDDENQKVGHYVVVISASERGVRFIDGTTASIGSLPMPEFQKRWSRYLLVLDEPFWWRALPFVAIGLGSISIALAFVSRRNDERFRRGGAIQELSP